MKNVGLFFAGIICSFQFNISAGETKLIGESVKVSFTENKGQVADQFGKARPDVLFGGKAGMLDFHLRKNGISYQVGRNTTFTTVPVKIPSVKGKYLPLSRDVHRIDVNWLNTSESVHVVTGGKLNGHSNYYLPACPDGVLDVSSYFEVTYKNIYQGIDLRFYENDGDLKYDFILAAGADFSVIRLEVEGADEITLLSDGSLLLKTPLGNINEGKPVVFQEGRELQAAWEVKGNVLSFKIEGYNPAKPMLIDPATRIWGTFYGATGNDSGGACSADSNGNAYMSGFTESASGTIIATSGSHQNTINGVIDAFLVKFDPNGARLWATYYGDLGLNLAVSCANDPAGNVFLTGLCAFAFGNALVTANCHQGNFGGGFFDGFLAKFNSSGVRQWGTLYGGSGDDFIYLCSADAGGNVLITGNSDSDTVNVISSPGSHQPLSGGSADAFIAKFNGSGFRQWASYYGGTGDEFGNACHTDINGNVYLAGTTDSGTGTVIATAGAHQGTFGGIYDGFLVKFDQSGVRQWSTYYGDIGTEESSGCTSDPAGNVYLAGYTDSNTGIATPASHQPQHAGNFDGFLAKFNSSGVIQWGTYFGGADADSPYNCVSDIQGNVYMAGATNSGTGTSIATPGSHQFAHSGNGSDDAFLVQFSSAGVRQWGTYYGSIGEDYGLCAVDNKGNVLLSGNLDTVSAYLHFATPASHQPIYGGQSDGYLVKFSGGCIPPPNPVNTTAEPALILCTGMSTTLTASGSGTISWYDAATGGSVAGTGTVLVTQALPAGNHTWYIEAFDCIPSQGRAAVTVTVSSCAGISELKINKGWNIYPNPASTAIMISVEAGAHYQVLNALGEVVMSGELNQGKTLLQVQGLARGIYLLRFGGPGKNQAQKVILE